MRTIVTITKTIEDFWGMDDLWDGRPNDDPEAIQEAIDLLREDISSLLDGAEWEVKRVEE